MLELAAPIVLWRLVPPDAGRPGNGALEGVFQVVRREGCLEDVVGAEGGSLGDALDAVTVGDNDDRARAASMDPEAPQDLDPVSPVEIESHQGHEKLVVAERGQGLFDGFRY